MAELDEKIASTQVEMFPVKLHVLMKYEPLTLDSHMIVLMLQFSEYRVPVKERGMCYNVFPGGRAIR